MLVISALVITLDLVLIGTTAWYLRRIRKACRIIEIRALISTPPPRFTWWDRP